MEDSFSKLKHILRKVGARTKEVLIEATGRALEVVSVQDVRGSSPTAATALRRSNHKWRCQYTISLEHVPCVSKPVRSGDARFEDILYDLDG